MLAIKTVLHPTDFTELSTHALHLAHSLARDYSARLVLLHVKMPSEVVEGEFGMTLPDPPQSDQELLDRLQVLLPANTNVNAEGVIAEGHPSDEIVRVAKEERCDLIVMGTHGRSGLSRVFLGSVADSVTRNASCPVVTVRTSQTEIPDE
ncbi:MAG: universal stress protein [Gemmataceae bacterium]